jgi:uncharacterized SAM-binding protein YcdF (DUF218 family)
MEPGELKPILSALVLPPLGPLLLAGAGLLLAFGRRRGAGLALVALGFGSLALLGSHAFALLLARHLLPQVEVVRPEQLQQVQAIVVLGGGVLPQAPEYGAAQPSEATLARLRYGAWLARRTGKPLGFAGGVGWAAAGTGTASEGSVAQRVLREDFALALRWNDDQSRDTAENAQRMAALLRPHGIRRIALVTDATHMPRALAHFRSAGLEVLPAPTDIPVARDRTLLEWLPSAPGLVLSRQVLREWLGLLVATPR